MSKNRIPELEVIEFKGAKSIAEYSRRLRALGRELAGELDASSEEVQAVLSRQKGHPLLAGVDVRIRARKVAKRLRRAGELGQGVATEAVKFNQEFRVQFAAALQPKHRSRPKFDFNDDDGAS